MELTVKQELVWNQLHLVFWQFMGRLFWLLAWPSTYNLNILLFPFLSSISKQCTSMLSFIPRILTINPIFFLLPTDSHRSKSKFAGKISPVNHCSWTALIINQFLWNLFVAAINPEVINLKNSTSTFIKTLCFLYNTNTYA